MARNNVGTGLVLLFLSAGNLGAGEILGGEPVLPILTSGAAIHNLTPSESKRRQPVHLRAVCVVCFEGWHGFFANDGFTGFFVEIKDQVPLTAAIRPGTLLDIEGVTGPGEFAPIIDEGTLRVLGQGAIPPARQVSLDRLSTGVEDGQWVAFEGTVRSAEIRDSMRVRLVASGRSQVEVMTPIDDRKEYSELIGARVRVRGTVGPVLNQRRQLIAVNVYSPGSDAIQVLEPAPADAFSLPERKLRDLFEYVPGAGLDRQVRIHALVTARWGYAIFVTDGIQGASLLSAESISLESGDVVDAVGFPVLDNYTGTIQDAIFRRRGRRPLPAPRSIDVKQALSGDFDSDLVRIDGRLIEQQRAKDQRTFLLEADDSVFSAILPGNPMDHALDSLRDGSQIQLTGICMISETMAVRHFRVPKAFQLLLRSSRDITVLRSSAWPTLEHALYALGIPLLTVLAILGWVLAFRAFRATQTATHKQLGP
ncbi:MAG: hypothetical protein ABSH56_32045 [Bryobacteraceae bacterium]